MGYMGGTGGTGVYPEDLAGAVRPHVGKPHEEYPGQWLNGESSINKSGEIVELSGGWVRGKHGAQQSL